MPRRLLLTIVALVLAALAGGSGCADDVAPAARIGDDITISHEDLLDEVAQWSESPKLVEALTGASAVARGDNYDMNLVTAVLTNRIIFEVFSAEFDRRELEVDPAVVAQIDAGLIPNDPAASAEIRADLDPDLYDEIVNAFAEQDALVAALGDDVDAFVADTFADIEVSSRYGEWDASAVSVIGPSGPVVPLADPNAP